MTKITKRELLTSTAAATFAAGAMPLVSACSHLSANNNNTPSKIDMHLHIFASVDEGRDAKRFPIWEYGQAANLESTSTGTLEEALRDIKAANFDRAVVANIFPANLVRNETRASWSAFPSDAAAQDAEAELQQQMITQLHDYNQWAVGLGKAHPAVIPFVGADLGAPFDFDHLSMLEQLKSDGAQGIKIHPVIDQRAANDKAMWPIYEACIKLNLPVLAHSGPSPERAPIQHAEPNAFHDVLRAFPTLKLVVAHLGGASWRQTRDLAEAFPEILFDACEIIAFDGAPNAPTREELARLIKDIGPHRVAFGSDYPWYDLDTTVSQLMDLPLLSLAEKEAILGANAAAYLGLDI